MHSLLKVVGYLLIVAGTIWFFQGINVLPGSFMTGQIEWAIYGGLAFAIGIVLVLVASRLGKPSATL